MNLGNLVRKLFLGVSLAVSLAGCSNSVETIAKTPSQDLFVEKERQNRFDSIALNYFNKMDMPINKVSKYLGVYKRFNLSPPEIFDFSNQNLSPEFVEKALSLGYESYEFRYIKNINLEKGIKFKEKGFESWEITELMKSGVPLDYAVKKKDILKFPFKICMFYHSCLREDPIDKRNAREIYSNNIFYSDLKDIDVKASHSKIAIPKDIAEQIAIYNRVNKIKDPKRFRREVFSQAKKLGYNPKKIKSFSPKECVEASVRIVASRIKWADVDNPNSEFFKKHGALSFDEYFHYGKGDCDKQSSATCSVFEILKDYAGLENVYMTCSSLGGNYGLNHAWNTEIFIGKNRMILSDSDSVQCGLGKGLDATPWHVNKKIYVKRALKEE